MRTPRLLNRWFDQEIWLICAQGVGERMPWALLVAGVAGAVEPVDTVDTSETVGPVETVGTVETALGAPIAGEADAQPLRAASWIVFEEATLIVIDGWVKRPSWWGPPEWSNFQDAFRLPPVLVDDDRFFVNFVLHPMMGAHFYMAARNHGLNPYVAALYSFGGSLVWEFLVESWFTRPVVLDTVVTPGLGVPLGIVLSELKKPIRKIHSRPLRGLAMLPVDPLEALDVWCFGGPPLTRDRGDRAR